MAITIDGTTGISGVDGTVSNPALEGTDNNTGVYFPAADTVSISTGGAERFRIGSAGQLGIGGATYGTSGQVLTSNGASAAPSWNAVSATGQLIRAPQILTSGTSYTTPSNCTAIYVECGGAGGGSGGVQNGGASSGGGGGGYSAKYFTVTGNTAYTYAIGAAGTAGGNQVPGGSGGNTTFTVGGTTITAGGGAGGGFGVGGSYSQGNASGGTATNGDMNRTGGVGGSSYFISGNGLVGTQGIGILGNNGGLGVKTTSGSDVAGQAGIGGIIRIWEFT